MLENEKKDIRHEKRKITSVLVGLVFILVVGLLFDLLNGHVGNFRYYFYLLCFFKWGDIINTDKVYQKIQDNDIKVVHFGLPNIKSVSIEADGKYGIFINHEEIEDIDEEFIVATHEYGHCMTGSTHLLYSPLDIISKHEYQADQRAVLDFLPIEDIKMAIKEGCQMAYEFAEYLDLPEQFIIKAFKHYAAMGLI